MAGDPQIELRLTRLGNDRDSIYEILGEMSSTLQEHTRRFDVIDGRFDAVDQRFESMDRRFDGVETTLAEIVRRLPEPS